MRIVTYEIGPEKSDFLFSNLVYEIIRLRTDGAVEFVATFYDLFHAEAHLENLSWEWPGDYVIRHAMIDLKADCPNNEFVREA